MRELYNRNPSDVRFLIPVLHGLQKASAVVIMQCASSLVTGRPHCMSLTLLLAEYVFTLLHT